MSDHIPLAADATEAIERKPALKFFLNESPLTIYLHKGGWNAVYFDLVADDGNADRLLKYIEVRVQTNLPSNALVLSRGPLNELLDHLASIFDLPLIFSRLELLAPSDLGVLLYEVVLPYNNGVRFGPLGGIQQQTPFATFDAIFRESITNPSPYYKFLCACRAYEGVAYIRKWLKQQANRFNVQARLPRDPEVDREELLRAGLAPDVLEGVTKIGHLFEKFRIHRNALAHFIVEGRFGEDLHINVAQGQSVHEYTVGAAVLLKYAREAVTELKRFYRSEIHEFFMRGTVLPMIENTEAVLLHGASAPAGWFLIDAGVLPRSQDGEKFARALVKMTWPSLFEK